MWTAVVEIVAPRDKGVATRVALAESDPAAYVKKHAKELRARGITKPVQRLPLVALLDGLEVIKRVALVDHRAAPEDVAWLLLGLRGTPKLPMACAKGIDDDDERPVDEILSVAAAAAKAKGLALVNMDTESDQYAIVVVPKDAAARLARAISLAGGRGAVITVKRAPDRTKGKKKTTAASRGPARAGTAMEIWPDASKDAPGTWRYFVRREDSRSLCTVFYPIAYDVHAGPLGGSSRSEKLTFESRTACTTAYLAYLGELERGGWEQLEAAEHQKASLGARASKKKR